MRTNNAIKDWKDYVDMDVRRDDLEIENNIAKGGLTMGTVAAGLIGIWALACLIGGIANEGVGEMVRGFMTAIGG